MFSRVFRRATTELNPATPMMQAEGSQQQQGLTLGNTLVQQDNSSIGTKRCEIKDASCLNPPNPKMAGF